MTEGQALPALVVVAHQRTRSLQRLLDSLNRLDVPNRGSVPLVISIDGGSAEVVALAEAFEWRHGDKRVVVHPALGLRDHILACGDFSVEYGAAIVLEDDLYSSPDLLHWAVATRAAYAGEPRIGGVSTYAYRIDELSWMPFVPLDDGHDALFLQMPSSWGQLWTAEQWTAFRDWYAREASRGVQAGPGIPQRVAKWPATSWKKFYLRFLVETEREFVYPRMALTTNCCEPGYHTPIPRSIYATPICRGRRNWSFPTWKPDAVRYDAWFEPRARTLAARWPELDLSDVDVDLRGAKRDGELFGRQLLSIRQLRGARHTFPLTHLPLEENLAHPGAGRFFELGERTVADAIPLGRRVRLLRFMGALSTPRIRGAGLLGRPLYQLARILGSR